MHFPILLLLLWGPFFCFWFCSLFVSISSSPFFFGSCCSCFALLFIVAVVGFCWVILCRVRYHQLAERATIGSSNPLIWIIVSVSYTCRLSPCKPSEYSCHLACYCFLLSKSYPLFLVSLFVPTFFLPFFLLFSSRNVMQQNVRSFRLEMCGINFLLVWLVIWNSIYSGSQVLNGENC